MTQTQPDPFLLTEDEYGDTRNPRRIEVCTVRKAKLPGKMAIGHQGALYRRKLRKRDAFPVWEFLHELGPVYTDEDAAKRDAIASGMPYDEHARAGGVAITLNEAITGRRDRTLHHIGGTGIEWGIAHRIMRTRTHVCVVKRTNGRKGWIVERFLGDFRSRQWDELNKWAKRHGLAVVHVDQQTGKLPKTKGEPVVCRVTKKNRRGKK